MRYRFDGHRFNVGGEGYWCVSRMETRAVCPQGHPIVALQTAAGIWFAACESCAEAELAGPDILDLLTVAEFPKAQEPRAKVSEDPQLEAPAEVIDG